MTPLLAQRPRADRAFERLYQRHVHAVYRYALAVLHNEADAEDVTQITFLSAYRAFARGERPELPHNWLIKIAHNVCRQRFREAQRRPQEVAYASDDAFAAPVPDDEIPTADEIRRALGFLSFNQRAALVMRELEGRTYAEIGEVLELSVSAVETLLFRARRALREQLEGGLTCEQTESTLARLAEGGTSPVDRGALRAHLRECKDCAALERRSRAQRAALKHLATAPLPASLASFFGTSSAGGGLVLGGAGLGAKAAAVVAAGLVSTGLGHEAIQAVAAQDRGPSAAPVAPQRGGVFSPVSVLSGGRAPANPLIETTFAQPPAGSAGTTPARNWPRRRLVDGDGATPDRAAAAPTRPVRTRLQPPSPVRDVVSGAVRTVTQQLPARPQVPVPRPVNVPVQVPPVPPVTVPPVPQPPPPQLP